MRRPSTPARAPDTPGGTVVEVPARTAWQRTVGVSVPAHTRRDIQISLDGVTWTAIAGLRPASIEDDDWTM